MSNSDRGDRGALVALALVISAVVIIFLFDRLTMPVSDFVGPEKYQQVESGQQSNVSQPIASADNPWSDSYAQWLMAIFSVAATAVSYLAVRLVRKTLAEAQETTKATVESNKVAREAMVAQTRPWLSIVDAEVVSMKIDEHNVTVVLKSTIKNTGNSPALGVSVTPKLTIFPKDVFGSKDDRRKPTPAGKAHGRKAVFTNADLVDTSTVVLPMKTVIDHEKMERSWRESLPDQGVARQLHEYPPILFVTIAVEYEFVGSDKVHMTFVSYTLWRSIPGQPETTGALVSLIPGIVDVTDVKLVSQQRVLAD